MTNPSHVILFTGGVPLDTVEDVFRTLAGAVGSRAYAYPHGENDGRAAMDRRIDAARTANRGFGVAHHCGYIWNLAELPRLLSDLLAGADHQREA
jgi:hypothetical protein